ncbi:hypothetical protein K458DRAFT_343230 [Lentithecium fluviatile CBS 122367]|uniref:Mis12-Mtw1 family protein n=1 Tax=Lentithecium fluviatile CBS 122367 TaxID=1168545 RepID=A0A6G1ITT1_9PLEO|nr:hypothetical protein K458DRAFT_343230 [Lentithecium fluviatile CBS 122367]
MTAILIRSPLQSLPMATNRPTTRRRSVKAAFEEEDAPVAKRAKTETNGTVKRTNGAKKATAKAAYDENDDGFQFTRRTSRRTTKAQLALEPIPDEHPKPTPARKKKNPIVAPEPVEAAPQRRRRSARLSGDKHQLTQVDGPPETATPAPAPKRTKKSAPTENEKSRQATPAPEREKGAFVGTQTPKQDQLHVSKKRDGGATKIMLPFADTPVITRNKEMRKKDGHRRSSTGLRGRRASSLIDSGMSNALPHSEVEVRSFFKYIEQSLPEPRRMKQLLTWCGSRALPDKPSGDVKNANAIMAARAIQQELIDDFASKPELSDWFSREDTAPPPTVKKPNPQNEKNKATLQELEEEVKRLGEEKAAWEALASSSNLMPTPPLPTIQTPIPSLDEIDASLLDPSQAAILLSLQHAQSGEPQPASSTSDPKPPSSAFTFTTPTALKSHLTKLSQSLEPSIDLFADGVHKIEQYHNTAERAADRVLGTAAKRLEERERGGKEKVGSEGIGVGDVLRGLAGVLNDS